MRPSEEEEAKRLLVDIKRDVISARDADAADRFFAPDYENDVPGRAPGREGLKVALREFFAAFHDIEESVDVTLAEGDLVATRSTMRATHRGAFLGVPPTGRRVVVAIQEISLVREGRVARQWVAIDFAGILAQLRG